MSQDFEALKAATVDGRTHSNFHRQSQLQRLHSAFREEASVIQNALQEDSRCTAAEAAVEFYATMKSLTDAYYSLDPKRALEDEYAVAKSKSAPCHREPVGAVYIEPTRHTRLFSTIGPLCSAIAAGNCTVVLLEQNIRALDQLLRRILVSALEPDSFAIATRAVTDELPLDQTIFVLQDSHEQLPRSNQLISTSSAPVVALVDRTANLELAAKELVAARFSFAGHSPYAPDVVLVNEFVQDEFVRAVVQECIGHGSSSHSRANDLAKRPEKTAPDSVSSTIDALRKADPNLSVMVHDRYAVVKTTSRDSLLLSRVSAPVLNIFPIRSLDDGIDIVSQRTTASCSAAYHFGTAETCKYLAQFVPSAASFANHIPRELLLGPIAPLHYSLDLSNRYPQDLFTRPQPQYCGATSTSQTFKSALYPGDDSGAAELMRLAVRELDVQKRSSGSGIGFFEQGLLLNVFLILSGTIATSIAGGMYVRSKLR